MHRSPIAIFVCLVFIGIVGRLIPHLPNMTALGAIALKGRERFGYAGLLIPIAAMLLSDIVIGFYDWRILISVYASYILFGTLGSLLRHASPFKTSLIATLGSILFFLITNAAVWAFSPLYPHTTGGLLACYIAAVPFLASMLLGDIVYSVALFHGHAWLAHFARRLSPVQFHDQPKEAQRVVH